MRNLGRIGRSDEGRKCSVCAYTFLSSSSGKPLAAQIGGLSGAEGDPLVRKMSED